MVNWDVTKGFVSVERCTVLLPTLQCVQHRLTAQIVDHRSGATNLLRLHYFCGKTQNVFPPSNLIDCHGLFLIALVSRELITSRCSHGVNQFWVRCNTRASHRLLQRYGEVVRAAAQRLLPGVCLLLCVC